MFARNHNRPHHVHFTLLGSIISLLGTGINQDLPILPYKGLGHKFVNNENQPNHALLYNMLDEGQSPMTNK
jgi:hypothetical protein